MKSSRGKSEAAGPAPTPEEFVEITTGALCDDDASRLSDLLRRGDWQFEWTGSRQTRRSSWLGSRVILWPRSARNRRFVGIVSSRLGRKLDTRPQWFRALRAIVCHLDRDRDTILTAGSTTTAKLVTRCAEIFDVDVVHMMTTTDDIPISQWLDTIEATFTSSNGSPETCSAFVSPPVTPTKIQDEVAGTALNDRVVAALSHKLHILHLRGGGNWDQLARARLNDQTFAAASVFASVDDTLVPQSLRDELMSKGAVGHIAVSSENAATASRRLADSDVAIRDASSLDCERFFTHCTRRRNGPWPDQSEEEYLDDLILGSPSHNHSAFAALMRIVMQRRLIASPDAIRGAAPMVSFTEVPLTEVPTLRTFRSHRARWDFEPYGIAIDREWLVERGAERVIYGDDACWASLSEEQRPFFQKSASEGKQIIDWTIEREWRALGNVDLGQLQVDDAVLFVPIIEEARHLTTISPWQVVVLKTNDSI